MKALAWMIPLLLALPGSAQITLEHVYPDAGFFHHPTGEHGQLFLWDFEASGMKYVKIDRAAKEITLYHLDHTFYKSMSFADAPTTMAEPTILYLSEHLFDLDDEVEYFYHSWDGMGIGAMYSRVYDEDGTVLLNVDTGAIYVAMTVHHQQYPILNTPEGAKLMVSHQPTASVRVYRLPGTLACPECNANVMTGMGAVNSSASGSVEAYPNPAHQSINLRYELPPLASSGRIVLFNAQGQEVRGIPVDNRAHEVSMPMTGLAAGSYYYHLRTPHGTIPSVNKLVIH